MYPCEIPDDPRVSVAQLNSKLRQAQLELLSAHCAVHQLRLHYSVDELARFGRPETLRRSAEAADALSAFFAAVEQRIPAVVSPPASSPTDAQIQEAVGWLASYLQDQRERYFPSAGPLSAADRSRLQPYFSRALLDRVRVVELEGSRVAAPDFIGQVRALGFENLPDVTHMESLTFLDVVVFNEKLSERALFHALVHMIQIDVLGLPQYADSWVRGFLKTRAYFTVPLEVHAFSLASRYQLPAAEKFSVEDHVMSWVLDKRY